MSTVTIPFHNTFNNIQEVSFVLQMLACYAENSSDEQWLACRSNLIDMLEAMTKNVKTASQLMDQLDTQAAIQ
ncbi:hypothetical protein [Pseudovibrio sp. POLY-S9]|uniref:hypothetical protein n=1 Tax=Pseudovibrio sp. POLY-S9 TaxID=1576596 RepID=UPI00070E5344|nr:hypothetical protein [Pseudovibrio sp. POLY-S9]